MHQAFALLTKRLDHRRMAVTEITHGDTGHRVQIRLALFIVQPYPLAANESDGLPRVGGDQELLAHDIRVRENKNGSRGCQWTNDNTHA